MADGGPPRPDALPHATVRNPDWGDRANASDHDAPASRDLVGAFVDHGADRVLRSRHWPSTKVHLWEALRAVQPLKASLRGKPLLKRWRWSSPTIARSQIPRLRGRRHERRNYSWWCWEAKCAHAHCRLRLDTGTSLTALVHRPTVASTPRQEPTR